jgi:hypothetical protein
MIDVSMPDSWENETQRDRQTLAGPTVSSHPSLQGTKGVVSHYGIRRRMAPRNTQGRCRLMARIRSVKPELRTDLTVGAWPIPVRYAWVLLWGYLDDSGRGRDDLRLLVSDLFPLDRDVTERKLDGWLTVMATTSGDGDEPPLCRYEVDGRRFLHCVKWGRHQRISHATDSRMPPCPVHDKSRSDS